MDDVASKGPVSAADQSVGHPPVSWIVACLLAVVVLSLAAAQAPSRMRLIGLYFVAFGLLVGWLTAFLASELNADPSRFVRRGFAGLLTLCGLIGCTYETARQEQLLAGSSNKDALGARLIEQMKTQGADQDTISLQSSPVIAFRQHLSRRIRQLGEWGSPWPELFWAGELLIGVAASVWSSGRFAAGTNPADTIGEKLSPS